MKLIAPKSIARALGLNYTTTIGRFIIMAEPLYKDTETYLEVDFRASSSALISLALFSEIS